MALELGCRLQGKGRKPEHRLLSRVHLVYVDRRDLGDHHQIRVLRHDMQDWFPRQHHLAGSDHRHAEYDTRHRRPNLLPSETFAHQGEAFPYLVLLGAETLEGLGGDDNLSGGAGVDVIDGGEANDGLTGGADTDIFVFEASHGNDTITDFEDGTDIIDLSALDGVTSFDDLTITASGNDAVINTGQGTITLTGVSTDDLDADDFVFSTIGDSDDNTIGGGWWHDTIEGLGSNDSLTGGTGADTFVFETGHRNDTITDFTGDWDTIDLSSIASITGFEGLTFSPSDDGVVINTGEGTILLEGVELGDIDADDFIFYEAPPHDPAMDSM